jgi:CRP-like cAMP-binding protein
MFLNLYILDSGFIIDMQKIFSYTYSMKENYNKRRLDIYVEKFRMYLQQNVSLPYEIINIFVSAGKFKKYKKGEFFSKQGEFSNKTAYICAGIFNLFSLQEDGRVFVMEFLKENDFIQSRIDFSTSANITVQALCETVVIEFNTNVLHEIYLQYPEIGNFARQIIENYIDNYSLRMIQIGTQKAQHNYLLFQNKFQDDEGCIPQHLIAAYLGITPTQLSRIRKKLSHAQQEHKK